MTVTLVHPNEQRRLSAARLIDKCTLFADNLTLLGSPYVVKSSIPLEIFRDFVSALEEGAIEITNVNISGLSLLCTEFGFDGLAVRLSEFRSSAGFRPETADAEGRARIAVLEERGLERDRDIAQLQAEFRFLSVAVDSLRAAVAAVEVQTGGLLVNQGRIEAEAVRVSAAVVAGEAQTRALRVDQAQVCAAVEVLQAEVSALKLRPPVPSAPPTAAPTKVPTVAAPDPRPPLSSPQRPSPAAAFVAAPPAPAPAPAPAGFDSLIVADFPPLFAEFRGKRFRLLWRGSRDGFGSRDFHRFCDGHANTLTLIADTQGNIFGGFTPVEWGPAGGMGKGDPSVKSFLFSLTNPHNSSARKFPLKPEAKNTAIVSNPRFGPIFGAVTADLFVVDRCNASADNRTTDFGAHYANDTALIGGTVFTGSGRFTVKEIEVFEIGN